MTTLREAAQQALAALEIGYDSAQAEAAQFHAAMAGYRPERHAAMDADVQKIAASITALRAALAQQEQEPVAWRYKPMIGSPWSLSDDGYYASCKRDKGYIVENLFTDPPRREWQSLSEEEIDDLSRTMVKGNKSVNWLTLAILAALKEKNA
jgi:hypothetical protein